MALTVLAPSVVVAPRARARAPARRCSARRAPLHASAASTTTVEPAVSEEVAASPYLESAFANAPEFDEEAGGSFFLNQAINTANAKNETKAAAKRAKAAAKFAAPKKGFGSAAAAKAPAAKKEGAALAASEKACAKLLKREKNQVQWYVISARAVVEEGADAPLSLADWLPVAEIALPNECVRVRGGSDAALAAVDGPLADAAAEAAFKAAKGGSGLPLEFAVEALESYLPALDAARKSSGEKARAEALKTLGLDAAADSGDRGAIKKAYRSMLAKYHPDRNQGEGEEEAAAAYSACLDAYETLAAMGRGGSAYEALAVGSGKREMFKLDDSARATLGLGKGRLPANVAHLRALVSDELLCFRTRNAQLAKAD